VCVSRFVASHLQLADDPRVRVISACCRDSFFQGELARRRYVPGGSEPLKLASIGNIVRWKKWDLAIQGIAELPPEDRRRVQFTLWGPTQSDDDSRQFEREMRELVARHKLEGTVHLPGSAPSVVDALRETDWVIHPTFHEPCAVSVIEALATGVPVLSPTGGGPVEITGPGSLSFTPDDPRDLARQIQRILKGEFRAKSPVDLRESVRHRSATGVARQYGELYDLVTRRPS
jgi:glycosyltransferase involved in cell wall biosynthesis